METSKSSSNPYVYDKPVTGEKFFGRRNEFEQIMRAASEHRLVVLRGQPKIGITSILLNLPSEMNYSHKVLYLDMREIAQNARRASDLWQAIETKGKSPLLSEAGSFSQKVDEGAVQHDDDGQFFQRSFLRETSYIRFIFDHFDAVASALDDMALTAFFRGFARILREERFVFIVASSTFPNKWKGAKFEDPSRVSVISISTLDMKRQLIESSI
ncbi:MAG: ATP-binding protein [Chloroflexi bacterium]|nr:ATP-binding protein [Chloroflexota bacterium]